MHYLEIGGAETALIGLLHALDPQRVDVDLFLHAHRGELLAHIPSWVNVLPELRSYASIEAPAAQALRRGCFGVVYGRWRARKKYQRYARRKRPCDNSALFGHIAACVTPHLPSLRRFGHYDLAISFLAPHDFVLRKVDAAKRICWIHTDYSAIDVDTELELPVWSGYDAIASISPDVTDTFCARFPSLREKIVHIGNIAPENIIRTRAAEPCPADMPAGRRLRLLSVGRYCEAKNLEAIPQLCRMLGERGIDVDWYIIGYGGDGAYIRKAIEADGMQHRVHILGKRANPYPYIAACDWYVQPSRYEGNSVVVREAQMLGKPVIVTAYATAASQVENGVDGIIVPMSAKECADAMAAALTDAALRARICANTAARDYSNRAEAEKIYKLAHS